MKKKDLIQLCRYYKGEEENPFEQNPKGFFWECERMYIEKALHISTFHTERIKDAKDYIHTHPTEKNALTSSDISIETKGIILYIDEMLGKWMPYNLDMIFDY